MIKNALLEKLQDAPTQNDPDINDPPASEIYIDLRSVQEFETMRKNITELSDDDFEKYARSISSTAKTRKDLEDFDKLISSLPLPIIKDSEIVWINHDIRISEDTDKRYDIVYISLLLGGDEWVRFEYDLSQADPKSYIDKLSSNESFSGTVYENPVIVDDSSVFAEKNDNINGVTTCTWYAVSEEIIVRAVYKSSQPENNDIDSVSRWLKIGTIDNYLN